MGECESAKQFADGKADSRLKENAMTRFWRVFERYLDWHWHVVLGELLYFTPGALDRYKDIPFPPDMRLLAKLLS